MLPVYPAFVFKEFLAALACILVLAWLGLLIEAPLDVPANPDFTPNPAKAPWYFLGIQEMLLYFDPWLAGVVIPFLIVSGLILIPLLDADPRGAGYYSFRRRIWATLPFTAGLRLAHGNGCRVPWIQLGLVLALARLEHGKTGSTEFQQPSKLAGPVFDRHLLHHGNTLALYFLAQPVREMGAGSLFNLHFPGIDHGGSCNQGFAARSLECKVYRPNTMV